MKRSKTIFSVLAALTLILSLAACGNDPQKETTNTMPATESQKETAESTKAAESQTASAETPSAAAPDKTKPAGESAAAHADTLVAYFSATGTTKGVAEKIAEITDADLYEIRPAQEYTSEDLNWHDSSTRATSEQNDPDARPEIGSEPLKLEGYTTVYIGYPIWWGEEPRIMDTFVESYDFSDLTVIPFCTSASSGMGSSGKNLAEKAGSGNWLEGSRFASGTSSGDLESWIHSLK